MKRLCGQTALFLFACLLPVAFSAPDNMNHPRKIIVIGMDGLDPVLLERYVNRGELPHFKALASAGTFARLKTSNPPQSPVAWSCFISGCNPGHHDVFDFIVRDPSTYRPEIGMTEIRKEGKKSFRDLMAGLSGPGLQTRRKGKSFWDYLSERHIKSVVLRCPVTFPAEPLDGRLLSGMGTPDIRGTQGVFQFFTEAAAPNGKDVHGRVVSVSRKGNSIETVLTGPRVKSGQTTADATVPVRMGLSGNQKIKITIQNQSQELSVGNWSDWFRVTFKTGLLQSITGICRFHLNSVDPTFALYATPVNLDPQAPALRISYPTDYARELFQKMGNYYTQGMPYDTWALNEGRLSEEEFLDQAYGILDENIRMLRLELDRFDSGFFFCYFGITDLVQHMFWRYEDPLHPNKGKSQDPAVRDAIKNVYKKMDEVLREIEKKRDGETPLVVISDHGFGSFRRAVHVNSWLRDHGFLTLKEGVTGGGEFFKDVNWSQTKAYSLGFGGIYVNQFGREKEGAIYPGAETENVKREIVEQLEKWKDTDGALIIKKVYRGEELYQGPFAKNAPDLYIGFNLPYRASWQTGLGGAPRPLVEDNMKMWGGDHLCDPSLVPGVLVSDLKIKSTDPSLLDIAPSVLHCFDIPPDPSFEGKVIF